MKLPRLLSAVLLASAILSSSSLAWGPGGHMLVAKIAYDRLNKTAKAEADRLLAIDIAPTNITARSLNFIDASNWPDDIRPINEFKKYAVLHYIDYPFSQDGTKLPKDLPKDSNVVMALTQYVDTLKHSNDDNKKAEALRFVIHFVGDIHQPLHCTTRVSQLNPEGDRGGNLFTNTILVADGPDFKKEKINLHWYWDSGIMSFPQGHDHQPPDKTEVINAANALRKAIPDTDAGWDGNAFDYTGWSKEGFLIATNFVYNGLTPLGTPSDSYNKKAIEIVDRRVVWAGYRLAALLNAIWPETH
jgi:hypothetical protein